MYEVIRKWTLALIISISCAFILSPMDASAGYIKYHNTIMDGPFNKIECNELSPLFDGMQVQANHFHFQLAEESSLDEVVVVLTCSPTPAIKKTYTLTVNKEDVAEVFDDNEDLTCGATVEPPTEVVKYSATYETHEHGD